MDFIPYKVNEYLENTFYQVPKELFTNPYYKKLNSDSILLYALLLDRLSVSRKNEWIDEDGNVFLLFSRKEVEKKLKLSDKTVTKAFKQLAEHKLIYEKRLGFRKKNVIYVGKINHVPTAEIMNRKNYDSRNGENTIQESENLRPNYNNKNYNNRTNKTNVNFEQRNYAEGSLDYLYANNWEQLYDN